MANPFTIEPVNPLQALLAGQQGYDTAQKAYKQNQIDAARAGLSQGGLTPQSLAALVAAGDPQAPALYGALNQQATLAESTRAHKASEEQASKTFGLAQQKANERQFQVTKDEDENPIVIEHGGGKPAQVYRFGPNGALLPAGTPSTPAAAPQPSRPVIQTETPPPADVAPGNIASATTFTPASFSDRFTSTMQPQEAKVAQIPAIGEPPPGVSKKKFREAAGKEAAEIAVQKPQATAATVDNLDNVERLREEAIRLRDHPGLKGITGISGKFPNAPGSNAANAAALLDTLKSQTGFTALQGMRNASKTGGALGQVSDKENIYLQNNLTALERAQSHDAYVSALNRIVSWADNAGKRFNEAYERQYGTKLERTPRVKQEEEGAPPANVLKEGISTTFQNGQTWTLSGGKPQRIK